MLSVSGDTSTGIRASLRHLVTGGAQESLAFPLSMTRPVDSERKASLVRSSLDLLELPYSFSQVELLLGKEFLKEASARGYELTDDELEALHRARILVPLFRLSQDGRPPRKALRAGKLYGGNRGHWSAPVLEDLKRFQSAERAYDPAAERLVPRSQRVHRVRLPGYDRPVYEDYETSVYVYSQYQLAVLPVIQTAISCIDRKPRSDREPTLVKAPRRWMAGWSKIGSDYRDMAVAASALEPLYFSRVVNVIRLRGTGDIKDLIAWRQDVPVNLHAGLVES